MNTLLFDVLQLTTSDTALGIVDKFGGTMNGTGALKALDNKFITGSYKERSTVKTRCLVSLITEIDISVVTVSCQLTRQISKQWRL